MTVPALDYTQKLEAALTELLRLYDWRNEVGAAITDSEARQYGREKKAAWEVTREVLRGGETAIRGSQSSRQLPEGEIPSPATFKHHTLRSDGTRIHAGCTHAWTRAEPQPAKFTCSCGTVVYRSYEDYVDD